VRKILSILVALGLILALSAIALPTSAAITNTCSGVVNATSFCAGATANYTINFTAPVTLTPGNDVLSFTFGAGTNLTGVNATDVTVVDPAAGHPLSVSKADNSIEFPVPGSALIFAGDNVSVTINDVKNPTASGATSLCLDYKLVCCDAQVFCCVTYTIKPAKSTYKYILDFGPTFPGIADDFVPPFQACGQCGYGNESTALNQSVDVGWMDAFNITLVHDILGCNGYDAVSNVFYLLDGPADATVTMFLGDQYPPNNVWNWPPTLYQATLDEDWDPAEPWGTFPSGIEFPLAADHNATSQGWIHFDTPGEYDILVQLEYTPEAGECEEAPGTQVLASKTVHAVVYQWKEAFKIPLYAKWNLVSLPFRVFDSDIATMLESFPNASKITSIWNFDQCADDWFGYPDLGLTDMVDGDAYWIRLPYSATVPIGYDYGDWWVFGTDRPYEEAPVPFNYEVCEGWNMVGFTPVWDMTQCSHVAQTAMDDEYLWNWWETSFSFADYGRIYGWDPTTQLWSTGLPSTVQLQPGEGYWISFQRDGFINP